METNSGNIGKAKSSLAVIKARMNSPERAAYEGTLAKEREMKKIAMLTKKHKDEDCGF